MLRIIWIVSIVLITCPLVHAKMLFEEKFENTNFSKRGWYDHLNGEISNNAHIKNSTASFRCNFQKGSKSCQKGSPGRVLFEETEKIYVSYYVKYSENWIGSQKPYHPHEFHLFTNVDGKYANPSKSHLTMYIEQNRNEGDDGARPQVGIQDSMNVDSDCIIKNNDEIVGCDGNINHYDFGDSYSVASCNGLRGTVQGRDCYYTGSYWYSLRYWYPQNGKQVFTDKDGPYYKNDWHLIEVMFEMNTVTNGKADINGKIKYWFDGELVIDLDKILFRSAQHTQMQFNQFVIAPYIGDGSPIKQTLWIDNLSISTHKLYTNSTLKPPTNLHISNH